MRVENTNAIVMATDKTLLLLLLVTALASPAWGNPLGVQATGDLIPGQTPQTIRSYVRSTAGPRSISAGILFKGMFSAVANPAGAKKTARKCCTRGRNGASSAFFEVAGASAFDTAFSHPLNMTRLAMSDERSPAVNLSAGPGAIAVPEPGSLGLLATGLVGIAFVLRRRM